MTCFSPLLSSRYSFRVYRVTWKYPGKLPVLRVLMRCWEGRLTQKRELISTMEHRTAQVCNPRCREGISWYNYLIEFFSWETRMEKNFYRMKCIFRYCLFRISFLTLKNASVGITQENSKKNDKENFCFYLYFSVMVQKKLFGRIYKELEGR